MLCKPEGMVPLLATCQCLLSITLALAYESQHGRLLSFSSTHLIPCFTFHPVKHFTGLLSILEHIELFFTLETSGIDIP